MTVSQLRPTSVHLLSGHRPYETVGVAGEETTFARMANDLLQHGYSITPNAFPVTLASALLLEIQQVPDSIFARGGIGRQNHRTCNKGVRRNDILWIGGETAAQRQWLAWTALLQTYLNRTLLLGLFSFESHFSRYRPGDFYKIHRDAFKGQANRVLSVVAYLNPNWVPEDAGELVIYADAGSDIVARVAPLSGTLAVFLSEDFPHEVLATKNNRYSVTGWYRVNNSTGSRLDPPR